MTTSPSHNLLSQLRTELTAFAPFAQMAAEHVERFVLLSTQCYFEPGETVLAPAQGVVQALLYIRRGRVSGQPAGDGADAGRGSPDDARGEAGFEFEAGDLLPIGAALGARAVTSTYTAQADTFCLALPLAAMQALAQDSAPFADFLNHRIQQLLDESRRALQASFTAQSLAAQSLETRLRDLSLRPVSTVPPETPLAQALQAMHDLHIGSMLVADPASGVALGILTRHDVLGRITLPMLPLNTPIGEVMSQPLQALSLDDTAQDAALLMSRHGIRHVPVADDTGRAVAIVSERDLFALQRLSLKQLSTAIRAAPDLDGLVQCAGNIRRFAHTLLGQGVMARQLTQLISHLNDVLTERLVALKAAEHGVDMAKVCWLSFGSEGRNEQTISTDQDNGIVFANEQPDTERPRLLAFARDINEALDRCGYPLCKGNIMASNPACCLTTQEWLQRFERWIDKGGPEDLLNASIYFDFRALTGAEDLVEPMRAYVTAAAMQNARFRKQLATNLLRRRPALSWTGGIDTETRGSREVIDLKARGTAIYVDVARLHALAHGVQANSTRERFEAAAKAMKVSTRQAEAWSDGFEVLQMLRLRVQLDHHRREAVDSDPDNPNLIDVEALNDIDRRLLKESLRVAQRLQKRVEMDYPG